jgi:hypothetical protein
VGLYLRVGLYLEVPAQALDLGSEAGSVLEWEEDGERMVVRRAGRYASEDVHRALFEETPEPKPLEELKEGVRQYVKSRHARR